MKGSTTQRTPPMRDAVLIDALNNATSLELYQLATLVERLMTDPKRIIAIRKDLHLGQVIRIYDGRADMMRPARIVDMCDTQLTVQGIEHRFEWKLPYAAVEPLPHGGEKPTPSAPAQPEGPKPTRADFSRGQKVSFTDRHLQVHAGVITRCNPKTSSVACDNEQWTVPYAALKSVLDI